MCADGVRRTGNQPDFKRVHIHHGAVYVRIPPGSFVPPASAGSGSATIRPGTGLCPSQVLRILPPVDRTSARLASGAAMRVRRSGCMAWLLSATPARPLLFSGENRTNPGRAGGRHLGTNKILMANRLKIFGKDWTRHPQMADAAREADLLVATSATQEILFAHNAKAGFFDLLRTGPDNFCGIL